MDDDTELKRLRQRLGMMNDVELLQFCAVSEKMCVPNAAQGESHTADKLKIQLEESRAEWKRRYPSH